MAHKVYIYPALDRSGLGNLMQAWAAAEIFRNQQGLPMLAPQWSRLKLGPLLRRENDLRYYSGLFRQDQYVRGWRRFWLLRTAERIPAAQAEEFLKNQSSFKKNYVIEFPRASGAFRLLLPHRDYLKGRLEQMITPQVQAEIDQEPIDFEIACHLRRGDKPTMKLGDTLDLDIPEAWHNALPMGWFVNTIQAIREALGREVKVCVFSDGSDEQLEECLSLPGIRRAQPKSAIADILSMSRARLLITTCTSTFSYWSAFLGQMPTLWYPGTSQNLSSGESRHEIETDLQGHIDQQDGLRIRAALSET